MNKSVLLLAVLSMSVACTKVVKTDRLISSPSPSEQKSIGTDSQNTVTAAPEDLYYDLLANDSILIRDAKIGKLNSEETAYGDKISASSSLFKSFEFQLWTAEGKDADYYRDLLLLDATEELMLHLSELYQLINTKKMSPTKEGKKHSAEQSFYALAATMDVAKNKTSFYSVAKKALKKDANNQTLTAHEKLLVAGQNREIIIELIKARVDMLSGLALKNLTDKRDTTLRQDLKIGLFKLTGGALGSMDLPETFTKSNEATKDLTIEQLQGAQEARDFLVEIGTEKKLERTLLSAFSKIDLGGAESEENPTQDDSKEADLLKKSQIRNLIDELLK
jgi:hypothetical protein